ncbi:hypothetical protein LCGC14_1227340 [marine sediment metagenome]|uniref:Uncharacterized protein n=1 Tax=marine sediment metagenome TaxID=412755 RepID=A0A0F9L9H4_9ZZZZ
MKKLTKNQKRKIAKAKDININEVFDTPIIVKVLKPCLYANNINDLAVVMANNNSSDNYVSVTTCRLQDHYKNSVHNSLRYVIRWENVKGCRPATEGEIARFMSGRSTGDLKRTFRANDVYKAINLIN